MGKLGNLIDKNDILYRVLRTDAKYFVENYTPGPELFMDIKGCSVYANLNRNEVDVCNLVYERVKCCKSIYKFYVEECLGLNVFPIQQGSKKDHAILFNEILTEFNNGECYELSTQKAIFLSLLCNHVVDF